VLQLLVDSARGGGCCVDAGAARATLSPGRGGGGGAPAARGMSKLRWLELIADLALTEAQITRILEMRTEALRALNRCFDAREALAAQLLSAAGAAGGAPAGGGGALGAMSTAGSRPGASSGSGGAGAVAGGEGGGGADGGGLLTAQADKMRRGGYLQEVARSSLGVRRLLSDMEVRAPRPGAGAAPPRVRAARGCVCTSASTPLRTHRPPLNPAPPAPRPLAVLPLPPPGQPRKRGQGAARLHPGAHDHGARARPGRRARGGGLRLRHGCAAPDALCRRPSRLPARLDACRRARARARLPPARPAPSPAPPRAHAPPPHPRSPPPPADALGLANALSEVYYMVPRLGPLLPGSCGAGARPSAALVAAAAAAAVGAMRRDAGADAGSGDAASPCCGATPPALDASLSGLGSDSIMAEAASNDVAGATAPCGSGGCGPAWQGSAPGTPSGCGGAAGKGACGAAASGDTTPCCSPAPRGASPCGPLGAAPAMDPARFERALSAPTACCAPAAMCGPAAAYVPAASCSPAPCCGPAVCPAAPLIKLPPPACCPGQGPAAPPPPTAPLLAPLPAPPPAKPPTAAGAAAACWLDAAVMGVPADLVGSGSFEDDLLSVLDLGLDDAML
jgi:hypothetical protein